MRLVHWPDTGEITSREARIWKTQQIRNDKRPRVWRSIWACSRRRVDEEAGAGFALEHPEKLIDYNHRSVHEMTVKAEAVIYRYYGKGPRLSYWAGCSLGGQQALKEAQLYPADYDGISAGCPTYNRTHLHAWQLYVGQQALRSGEAKSLTHDKLEMLHAAVLDACDLLDGVKDGILNDPRQCAFDPAALRCRGSETLDCLTDAQVKMVSEMYAPAFEPATGNRLYPGAAYGSELAWSALIGGASALNRPPTPGTSGKAGRGE